MNAIKYSGLAVATLSGLLLILGLFKPWIALWWEPVQTRRQVVKLYGTVSAGGLLLYIIANLKWNLPFKGQYQNLEDETMQENT